MGISKHILTTTLAIVIMGLPTFGNPANAALDPQDVTAMLAKSQVLDSRCKILSADESEMLRDLVARAEIALATKFSVRIARESLARGRAAGKAAACNSTAAASVREIVKMGTQAATQASPATEEPKPAEATPVADKPGNSKPKPAKATALAAAAKPVADPSLSNEQAKTKSQTVPRPVIKAANVSKSSVAVDQKRKVKTGGENKSATASLRKSRSGEKSGLGGYASLAERYYVELKCRKMSYGAAQRMYQNVLAQHQAAMSRNGAAAVRKLLNGAKARAGTQSCADS